MTLGPAFDQVLADAQAGDRDALARLYEDLAPLVLGYVRANGAPDPEDVTSEVFVAMVRRIRSFEGDEHHFRSWLLTIAHRRLIDDRRARGRRKEDAAPLDAMDRPVIDLSNPASEALTRLHAQGVLQAIDELTDDQRSVLLLRTVADLPVREVAQVLGKSETAVKALQRRALATVKRHLEGDPRA